MKSTSCKFSICVPTHNRVHLLPRLIESFGRQTLPEFEVIIIDDGSKELVTPALKTAAMPFPELKYRCVRVPNGGRAKALNRAFDFAMGELVIIFDDDDIMPPTALERLWEAWESIPAGERDSYCGVAGLCAHADGTVIGDLFPERGDADYATIRYRWGASGDKKEAVRRDLLTHFRFKIYPEEKRCPTSSLFIWLAQSYRFRTINFVCAIKEYRSDGMSQSLRALRLLSVNTTEAFYRDSLAANIAVPARVRLRWLINLFRFRSLGFLFRSDQRRRQLENLALLIVALPAGTVLGLFQGFQELMRRKR